MTSTMRLLPWALTILSCVSVARSEEPAEIEVHWQQPIGPPLVGFGAQMNPYLYARPNWGDVTEDNVKDLEQKVVELRPQFVRVFMVPEWKQGKPDGVNKQGDPRMWESFLRTLRLAQRAGANVTLTTWYAQPSKPEESARETVATLVDLVRN